MDFEDDDLPQGFGGMSNWARVVAHLETYYVRWAGETVRWIGRSQRDDRPEEEHAVDQRAQGREYQRRWYAKLKQDPARVARRNAARRKRYREKK